MSLFIYFLSLIAAFLLSPSPHAPNYQRQLIWNNAAQKYLLSLSLAKNRYLFTRPQIFVSKSTNICRALPQNVPQSAVLIDRLLFGFASNPQIVRRQGCPQCSPLWTVCGLHILSTGHYRLSIHKQKPKKIGKAVHRRSTAMVSTTPQEFPQSDVLIDARRQIAFQQVSPIGPLAQTKKMFSLFLEISFTI